MLLLVYPIVLGHLPYKMNFIINLFFMYYVCCFTFRYLIRPSSLSPQPSPLIDERKQHQRMKAKAMKLMKREEPTGAEKGRESSAPDNITINQVGHVCMCAQPNFRPTATWKLLDVSTCVFFTHHIFSIHDCFP